MEQKLINELSALLYHADRMRAQVPPLSEQFPGLTEEDAYRIQESLVKRCCESGDALAGWKIGGISYGTKSSGGFGPHYGRVLKSKVRQSGDTLCCGQLLSPGLEAEAAVMLSEDLCQGKISASQAEAAIELIFPAWEIVESREFRRKRTLPDSVADNAASGGCVLGKPVEAARLKGRGIRVRVEKNQTVPPLETGIVSLEQLASSVAWLADQLIQKGGGLRAGEVILTGALTKPLLMLEAGDRCRAAFTEVGEVTISGK